MLFMSQNEMSGQKILIGRMKNMLEESLNADFGLLQNLLSPFYHSAMALGCTGDF